ncbi:branched-chain amino acid transport system II carrier protein [Vibrio lentus]|nr:branched-chain amino acid transport system II carrier protein [Vibrio lentus]
MFTSLFFLGATSATVAAGAADNGGAILSLYVQSLFGPSGQLVAFC